MLHVVDGQQRLTTLLILVGELRSLVHDRVTALEEAAVSNADDAEAWLLANLDGFAPC